MQFRYDFGEKLDLSKLKKQAANYINISSKIEYQFYTKDFKIIFNIKPDSGLILTTVSVYSLLRDADNEVLHYQNIYFHNDSRFNSFPEIINLFGMYSMDSAQFISKSSEEIIDKMCMLIKVMHKINHLKVFL